MIHSYAQSHSPCSSRRMEDPNSKEQHEANELRNPGVPMPLSLPLVGYIFRACKKMETLFGSYIENKAEAETIFSRFNVLMTSHAFAH